MSFSVVLAVGPGARERPRLRDLLTTLAVFETSDLREVFLLDDGAGLKLEEFRGHCAEGLPLRIVPSRREGKGDAWRGGLVTNILCGMHEAIRAAEVEFVLKLDTDSLLLRPCSEQIGRAFIADPAAGILGSAFRTNVFGTAVPPSTWTVNLAKWLALIRLRRTPFPRLETAFRGRNKRIRELTLLALEHGWPLGHCAQGGGYAVSGCLLEEWMSLGYFEDELLWRHTDLGEDIVTALLCYAAGSQVRDFNGIGEPFGVQFQGLAYPIPELFRRNYGVIHAVKADDFAQEKAMRREIFERLCEPTAFV